MNFKASPGPQHIGEYLLLVTIDDIYLLTEYSFKVTVLEADYEEPETVYPGLLQMQLQSVSRDGLVKFKFS